MVDELPVARAQGGTVHHVTAQQWDRLMKEADQFGWPSADSLGAGAVEESVSEVIRGRASSGQGRALTAEERSLVERRAMDVVTQHYTEGGWEVDDVSAASPYDLLCWKAGVAQRRVEVKGTTGTAAAVILTRNEVLAARADRDAAVLAVVHGIVLTENRTMADGGILRLISPWQPDDSALIPIAYRYQLPQ